MKWRDTLDAEFTNWTQGAWERAREKCPKIKCAWMLPHLKWIAFVSLLFGIVFLMAFVFVATGSARSE